MVEIMRARDDKESFETRTSLHSTYDTFSSDSRFFPRSLVRAEKKTVLVENLYKIKKAPFTQKKKITL